VIVVCAWNGNGCRISFSLKIVSVAVGLLLRITQRMSKKTDNREEIIFRNFITHKLRSETNEKFTFSKGNSMR
jgi:hypothetical protein